MISGRVHPGTGRCSAHMRGSALERAIVDAFGWLPFPGSLNVIVPGGRDLTSMFNGELMVSCCVHALELSCNAAAFRLPGTGQPRYLLELAAPLSLRDELGLHDGTLVRVELGS